MTKKQSKQSDPLHKYLIVDLEKFIRHPHLQVLAFEHDPKMWSEMSSHKHKAFAIGLNHPNLSVIQVMSDGHFMDLHGESEWVKPLI